MDRKIDSDDTPRFFSRVMGHGVDAFWRFSSEQAVNPCITRVGGSIPRRISNKNGTFDFLRSRLRIGGETRSEPTERAFSLTSQTSVRKSSFRSREESPRSTNAKAKLPSEKQTFSRSFGACGRHEQVRNIPVEKLMLYSSRLFSLRSLVNILYFCESTPRAVN